MSDRETEDFRQKSNAWFRLGSVVPTFWCYDKQTGERLLLDVRLFDPQRHERLDGGEAA